jgi:hypothetical protein
MKYIVKRVQRVVWQILTSHIISVIDKKFKEWTDGINPFGNDLLFQLEY